MRRLLFTGSPDWDDTRAISHLFLDLRSNRDILYCDMKSGAGSIAYDMGRRTDFKTIRDTGQTNTYDRIYMYIDDGGTVDVGHYMWLTDTLVLTLTHRRRPPTPETTPAPPADHDGTP